MRMNDEDEEDDEENGKVNVGKCGIFLSTFFAPSRVVIRGITTVAFEAKNELFQSRRCLLRSLRYLDRIELLPRMERGYYNSC